MIRLKEARKSWGTRGGPSAVLHICSWRHCNNLCLLYHVLVPPDTEVSLSLHWQKWAVVCFLRTCQFSSIARPQDTKTPAVFHSLPVTYYSFWGFWYFLLTALFLWLRQVWNGCAVLLWDLWGVISVPQLISSPVDISDVRIPFSKHCQGNDLLSAASFVNDDICTKYQWEAQIGD